MEKLQKRRKEARKRKRYIKNEERERGGEEVKERRKMKENDGRMKGEKPM